MDVAENLVLFPAVNKIGKSVKFLRSYRRELLASFYCNTV